jgi:hypothetical protein
MRTGLLIGLTVMLCVLTGVGLAAADSIVNYPDNPVPNNSVSLTIGLGGGVQAFVFIDNGGNHDIFVQVVNAAGNPAQVTFTAFTAYAFYFKFEGSNQGFMQYGVYTCISPSGQTSNVSSVRRGTLFL